MYITGSLVRPIEDFIDESAHINEAGRRGLKKKVNVTHGFEAIPDERLIKSNKLY